MKRYRICSICEREWYVSGKEKSEKTYICPHCEYKRSRPGTAIPKAAHERKNVTICRQYSTAQKGKQDERQKHPAPGNYGSGEDRVSK